MKTYIECVGLLVALRATLIGPPGVRIVAHDGGRCKRGLSIAGDEDEWFVIGGRRLEVQYPGGVMLHSAKGSGEGALTSQ